jgi:hypothetical protein
MFILIWDHNKINNFIDILLIQDISFLLGLLEIGWRVNHFYVPFFISFYLKIQFAYFCIEFLYPEIEK